MLILIAGKDPTKEISCGHSSYVRAHARAAVRAGFAPHIFSAGPRAGIVETDYGTVHRVFAPLFPVRQLYIKWLGPLLAAEIHRFLKQAPGAHLIHSFGVWGWAGVEAARRLARDGVPAAPVLSSYTTYEEEMRCKFEGLGADHSWLHRNSYRLQCVWVKLFTVGHEARAYRESDLVFANYDSVLRSIESAFGAGIKARKIPYTSESAFFSANGHYNGPRKTSASGQETSPNILCVARHEPNKGIDRLLLALAGLRDRGCRFNANFIGTGPLINDHRALAERLNLTGLVDIPGMVPEIGGYLSNSDIFVLPSLRESSGSLAVIEALQAGVPVVATRIDGIPEDVEDGDNALLVPPDNVEMLQEAIARLLDQPDLRRSIGEAGRRRFEEHFSADALADSLRKTYNEVLQEYLLQIGAAGL